MFTVVREIVTVIFFNFNLGVFTIIKRHELLGHVALNTLLFIIYLFASSRPRGA